MNDVRSWLHQLLVGAPTITSLLGDGVNGVYSVSSFESVPQNKPFLVHRLGLTVPELKDDNRTVAQSTPAQVWIHDLPGDYLKIDVIADEIKQVVEQSSSSQVVQASWTDLGDELRDPEMGTILRVARLRLVYKP